MKILATDFTTLWHEDFKGLACNEIFLTVYPCTDNFFELTENKQNKQIDYDKLLRFWGENSDQWGTLVIYTEGNYFFMWQRTRITASDTVKERTDILCHSVSHDELQKVYMELLNVTKHEQV